MNLDGFICFMSLFRLYLSTLVSLTPSLMRFMASTRCSFNMMAIVICERGGSHLENTNRMNEFDVVTHLHGGASQLTDSFL